MSGQDIGLQKKGRGRPAGRNMAKPIAVRLENEADAALDAAAAAEPDKPSRSELIRRIVTDWLKAKGMLG